MEGSIEGCAEHIFAHLQDKMARELVGQNLAIEAPEGHALLEVLGGPDQYREHHGEEGVDLIFLYYQDGKWRSSSSCAISLVVKEKGRFSGPVPLGWGLDDVLEPYTSEIS